MSIPVLIQVYDETRRLAIAGSAVAPGDFRLKRLIPPLESSAQKAPVFGKVAQAVQAVVESDEKTASSALLELTTLVNAILYTQGETGIAGELKPLETTDLGGQPTQAGARVLKPLLEALASTGAGRLELVRDAFERGTFKDLRLVKPALRAIDDPYPEIGDFISENVLPLYGKAILPELRASLDIKARSGGQLNRLHLIHRLDPEGSREFIQRALDDGSKEMKVAAIECLGRSEEDVRYLLEQASSRSKEVRASALRALVATAIDSAEVIAALKKAIAGPDLELVVEPIKSCALPEIQRYVLEQAEQQSADLFNAKDKKEQGPVITRLQQLVACLGDRTDAAAENFLLECFENAPAFATFKSEPSGADLNEWVAHILSRGTPTMQKRLVAAHKSLSGGMLGPAILAARATLSPADFYKEFSAALGGLSAKRAKDKGPEHDRAVALLAVLRANENRRPYVHRAWMTGRRYMPQTSAGPLPPLDPRWLDAAVDAGAVELVCALARPGHAASDQFLWDQFTIPKRPHESVELLRTMVRVGHPQATDAVIATLKRLAEESHFYGLSYWYGPMIADLPKSALPKLETLLPTLPDKMVDQLMEPVLALKNKSE